MTRAAVGALLGVSLALLACAESAESGGEEGIAGQSCTDAAVITGSGAGAVQRGMSAAELREACVGRDTTISLEGMEERAYSVPLEAGGSVLAMLAENDSVSRLTVTGSGPVTAEGVGVGATVAQVAAAYPEACLMPGEGRMIAIAPGTGVSFQSSAPVGVSRSDLAALPDTTSITAVFVHGEEAGCP